MSALPPEPAARRGELLGRVLPGPGVVVATLVSLLAASGTSVSATRIVTGLAVAGAALVWSLAVVLRLHRFGTAGRTVAVAGQLAFAAVLVQVSGWFGIYAFTTYLVVEYLPRPWQRPTVVVNAMIVAAAQIGGYPTGGWSALALYAGVLAVNVTLVLTLVRVAERMEAQNEQIVAALAENAGLHEQLVAQAREAGVLDERQRLAGELHDTLAQGLVGIVRQLEAAEQARHLPEQWQQHVTRAQQLARANLADARRSVQALRPDQLGDAGLVDALRVHVRVTDDLGPTAVSLEVVGVARDLPEPVSVVLFRVAQEALTNCAKHAAAAKATVTLTFLDDVVVLDVRDDGVGFDPARRSDGFGLPGMRRRVDGVGGRFEVETAPGDGVALSATVPT